jgi:hypothetical protein
MSVVPRTVRRLWTALGVLLIMGLAAYANFLLTGRYGLLVLFFNTAGAGFLVSITGAEACFAFRARGEFDATEPMHTTWTLVFLGSCCRLVGSLFGQVLSAKVPWNPLAGPGALHLEASRILRDFGVVTSGPVAMALLAGGLMRVILLNRRMGILRRLTLGDRALIGVLVMFCARQLYEAGTVVFGGRGRPSLTQIFLWFSDPLLTLLLMQAVSIRRSVLNLGGGLVARCWGMMAAAVAFTSLGDATLWAESHGFIPIPLSPAGWFIWFFAATAFASAPCYQVEAARLAHEGSYSPEFSSSSGEVANLRISNS